MPSPLSRPTRPHDRDLYVYCISLPDGNITAYQSPVMIGTNVKELKVPPNNPAYDAIAKAAEGEIATLAQGASKTAAMRVSNTPSAGGAADLIRMKIDIDDLSWRRKYWARPVCA